jgi:hypothetical protein
MFRKSDIWLALWVFGMAGAMCIFAWPRWEEPRLHVVKVKHVPTFIPKPVEVKR